MYDDLYILLDGHYVSSCMFFFCSPCCCAELLQLFFLLWTELHFETKDLSGLRRNAFCIYTYTNIQEKPTIFLFASAILFLSIYMLEYRYYFELPSHVPYYTIHILQVEARRYGKSLANSLIIIFFCLTNHQNFDMVYKNKNKKIK